MAYWRFPYLFVWDNSGESLGYNVSEGGWIVIYTLKEIQERLYHFLLFSLLRFILFILTETPLFIVIKNVSFTKFLFVKLSIQYHISLANTIFASLPLILINSATNVS